MPVRRIVQLRSLRPRFDSLESKTTNAVVESLSQASGSDEFRSLGLGATRLNSQWHSQSSSVQAAGHDLIFSGSAPNPHRAHAAPNPQRGRRSPHRGPQDARRGAIRANMPPIRPHRAPTGLQRGRKRRPRSGPRKSPKEAPMAPARGPK